MNAHHISQLVDKAWDEAIVPALREYVRIPNVSPSFEPRWEAHGHMRAAVDLLDRHAAEAGVAGLQHRVVTLPGRTPVWLGVVPGQAPGNALLYGHYDKQPPFEGWSDGLGPWTPVIRDGRLYGRGGADDGYALFASLAAIAALQRQGVPHPRCVVLIEGSEESGSVDLPAYMTALADEMGVPDLVVCLDAECGNYDQLWLTTSLRGMLAGTLTVRVLTEGVHSGAAGGIVPSSFRLLRQLIERVENAASGEIAALGVDIPAPVRAQAALVAETLGPLAANRFPWAGGTRPSASGTDALVLANTWGPSLEVVGLDGAPPIADAGNTLRPITAARLVFRLPPSLDAKAAGERVKAIIERDPPHNAEVRFTVDGALPGWRAPPLAPWLESALAEASRQHFDAPLRGMGTGGTIPFMQMLGERFPETQFAVTGVLGPQSNAHGPNEFLHIATGKRVTACVAHALAALGAQPRPSAIAPS